MVEVNLRMQDCPVGWVEVVLDEDDEFIPVTGHLFEATRFRDGLGNDVVAGEIFYDQLERFEDGHRTFVVVTGEIEKDVFRTRCGGVYRVRAWAA
jgi:hypothetical protein